MLRLLNYATVSRDCFCYLGELDVVGFCGCGKRVWTVGAVFAVCCFANSRSYHFSTIKRDFKLVY